jgi:hypothetical protein
MVGLLQRPGAAGNTEDLPLLDNLGTVTTVPRMTQLTEYTSHADRDRLNITHDCIDRWAADPSRVAIRPLAGGQRRASR